MRNIRQNKFKYYIFPQHFSFYKAHLHDDKENECDEDVDLRVLPGMVVADVVELLCDALTTPRTVVEQSDQRLMLRQLAGQTTTTQRVGLNHH